MVSGTGVWILTDSHAMYEYCLVVQCMVTRLCITVLHSPCLDCVWDGVAWFSPSMPVVRPRTAVEPVG